MQPSSPQSTSGAPEQTGLMPNTVQMGKMIENGLKSKDFYRTVTVKWDAGSSTLWLHAFMI